MPRGGARPGSGRKKGAGAAEIAAAQPKAIQKDAKATGLSPLDYMLKVMNDDMADEARRDRMAQAAAPYVHAKPAEAAKGKKEERQEAATNAANKFAPAEPPKLVVNNR